MATFENHLKNCPKCNSKQVYPFDKFCRRCGTQILNRRCGQCKTTILHTDRFCAVCGYSWPWSYFFSEPFLGFLLAELCIGIICLGVGSKYGSDSGYTLFFWLTGLSVLILIGYAVFHAWISPANRMNPEMESEENTLSKIRREFFKY